MNVNQKIAMYQKAEAQGFRDGLWRGIIAGGIISAVILRSIFL
jgi:hypothetical protein